jgi:hypothetical protein
MFMEHPSGMATASLPMCRVSLRRRRDSVRGAKEAVGARRGAKDTRRETVVMRRDAFGLRTAPFGARRAVVRLCLDARGLRAASLHVGTDAPFIPTDALCLRSALLVSADGGSQNWQRRPRRSMGSCLRRTGCRPRTSGRPARTSGCRPCTRGHRPNARTRFARSHAIIGHLSPCPPRLRGSGAGAKRVSPKAQRPFARSSGRRRWDSRRQRRRRRCQRRSPEARADIHRVFSGSRWRSSRPISRPG